MNEKTVKQNFYQLAPGTEFRQYRIEGVIGQGAMGVVYKAFDQHLQRYVALKVLQTNFIGEKEHKQFVREVKAIANLNHHNIVKLFEVGIEPTYYFTMEYIEGETLAQVIANENLSHAAITRIFSKIAMGLYHAHIKGVIHGDIKPDNIMITSNREPKIMDFGLAKDHESSQASQSGIQGTPAYMAPEQLQKKKVDKRADIYALGVSMYRSLTGTLPFNEKNYVSLFYQIINEEPPKLRSVNSSIPVDLELICSKCMQKSVQKRYANARFLARDLQNFLVGRPLWAESSSNVLRFFKRALRFWWLEIACTLSCLYLITHLVFSQGEIAKKQTIAPRDTVKKDKVVQRQKRILPKHAKYVAPQLQKDVWDKHNEKVVQVLPWYKNRFKHAIYNLKLQCQRYGYAKQQDWEKNAVSLAKRVHRQITSQSVKGTNLFRSYLETTIAIRKDGILTGEDFYFSEICDFGLEVAKEHELRYTTNKLENFQQLYPLRKKVHKNDTAKQKRIAELEKNNDTKGAEKAGRAFRNRNREETTKVEKIIVDPYAYFDLSTLHDVTSWKREKFLLHATALGDSHRFFEKLGEYYVHHFLYAEGLAACREALKRNPTSSAIHYYIAQALISHKKYSRALSHLKYLEKNYFNVGREMLYFAKARLFVLQKNSHAALKAIDDAKKWRVEHRAILGDFDERCKAWQDIAHNIDNKDFVLQLAPEKAATMYFEIGEYEKAYALIDEPMHNGFLKLAIYQSIVEEKLRNFDQADQIWKKANIHVIKILQDPNQTFDFRAAAYRCALMLLSTRHGKNYEKYINLNGAHVQYLRQVQTEFADYHFAHLYMAHFLKAQGQHGLVIELCNRAKNLAPWYKSEMELLQKICVARWSFFKGERPDISVNLAIDMVEKHNYAAAHNLLACIYTHAPQYKNAARALHHVQQIHSDTLSTIHFFDFQYDAAHVYSMNKMHDKALEYINNYLKIDPSFIYAHQALEKFQKKKRDELGNGK
ncbi:serine/threonine protein kinase [Candidatus Uabimicrobium amorphum]|uniref:Protein kinase n=1 Tax=Uabimicrobium amorphum TaxID=2596890 RepID=A0A5S9IID0_UABAM|nr:serine/threonine-protein kinase [Candidatus Uabimicrobium amorphum]BBM82379.1 protein kinase [Candidatus Uabimicrobium amorphum]